MGYFASVRRGFTHELRTVRGLLYRRLSGDNHRHADVATAFHEAYFEARDYNLTWRDTYWMGQPVLKCPLDLWLYQELVCRIRPSVIVETGTAFGGSALFLASICELIHSGRVITIDMTPQPNLPTHPRIEYIVGSSVAAEVVENVAAQIGDQSPVLVILDSDHSQAHVERELELYHHLVTVDSYLIVGIPT